MSPPYFLYVINEGLLLCLALCGREEIDFSNIDHKTGQWIYQLFTGLVVPNDFNCPVDTELLGNLFFIIFHFIITELA